MRGPSERVHDQGTGHDQGRSWAEVTARGTNLSHTGGQTPTATTTGPVALAGKNARHVPGEPAKIASTARTDGADKRRWVPSTVQKLYDAVVDPGREEREKIRQWPKAYLAWVSARPTSAFVFICMSIPVQPVTRVVQHAVQGSLCYGRGSANARFGHALFFTWGEVV